MALDSLTTSQLSGAAGAGFFSGLAVTGLILIWLIMYVYTSLTIMTMARRLKTAPEWLAWIPLAKFILFAKMAKMHWWPVLLLLVFWVPILNIFAIILFGIYQLIWLSKISERRNLPYWMPLIIIISPIWWLVVLGIFAWGKK